MTAMTLPLSHTPKAVATIKARITAYRATRAAAKLVRQAVEITGNQLTIAALMTYLGADDDTVLRFSGQLGKQAKEAYHKATGHDPEQSAAVVFRGRLTPVYAYGWDQLGLLIKVAAGYDKTAALITTIGA